MVSKRGLFKALWAVGFVTATVSATGCSRSTKPPEFDPPPLDPSKLVGKWKGRDVITYQQDGSRFNQLLEFKPDGTFTSGEVDTKGTVTLRPDESGTYKLEGWTLTRTTKQGNFVDKVAKINDREMVWTKYVKDIAWDRQN